MLTWAVASSQPAEYVESKEEAWMRLKMDLGLVPLVSIIYCAFGSATFAAIST
jgi:hypothetical protein